MKNLYIIIAIVLLLGACQEKKTEFLQSKVSKDVFLIKNPPVEDSLLKKEIISFLRENQMRDLKELSKINFYRYTSNTYYFIDNLPDLGGFSSEELSDYPEDNLAFFRIYKYNENNLKKEGLLYFYNDNFYKPDTIFFSY